LRTNPSAKSRAESTVVMRQQRSRFGYRYRCRYRYS